MRAQVRCSQARSRTNPRSGRVRIVTRRALRATNGDWIGPLAFSGDETHLVAGTSGGRLELWDPERGAQAALFCSSEAWTSA